MMTKKNAAILHTFLFLTSLLFLGLAIGLGIHFNLDGKALFGIVLLISTFVLSSGMFFVYRVWQYCKDMNREFRPTYCLVSENRMRIDDPDLISGSGYL